MTIQFYGAPMSSAARTHVMLEECGVPYEYHRINNRDPEARAAYLKINPGGKIPYLVDGDLALVESVAINFYLAEKYAPQLWSADLAERARIYSWSLWGISTLQHDALRVMHHSMIVPAEHRSAFEVETGKKGVQRYLDHLESELPAGGYLVGDRFTVADLNVGSVVTMASMMAMGRVGPKSQAWLDAVRSRPSFKKVLAAG